MKIKIIGGLIAIAVLILLFVIWPRSEGDAPIPPGPPIAVAADDLIDTYEKDAKEADRLYLGKVLEITGEIWALDVALGLGKQAGVMCHVRKTARMQNREQFDGLWIGDTMTIRGICRGTKTSFVKIDTFELVKLTKKKKADPG